MNQEHAVTVTFYVRSESGDFADTTRAVLGMIKPTTPDITYLVHDTCIEINATNVDPYETDDDE